MSRSAHKLADVLLVEDNPADVRLTREAMKEGGVESNLYVVGDGQAALDFLHRRGAHDHAPRPDLILLDLNLPKKSGREVLAEIKEDAELRAIPVVVLSTSKADEDISGCYRMHANCFISKPEDLDRFVDVVQQIEAFWLKTVSLPAGG